MEKSNIALKAELLCKSFINGGQVNNVIKNLNIEIKKGDFTIIMGSSGSGKSTLIYSLSGMATATSGNVYLGEREITGLTEKQMADIRREHIGFVFQSMNLIADLSVYENVMSPTYKNKKTKEELATYAKELLMQMGIWEQKDKFPNQLSGGERQRAAICRALINNPAVLFADEPTGALNSLNGEQVLDLFTDINKAKQTVVMVTHNLKAATRGNRIIFLKDGHIDGELKLESFDKSNIMNREKIIYEFLKKRNW
jgi:ABC-type antimicrobial peptide transport system, ATPase component